MRGGDMMRRGRLVAGVVAGFLGLGSGIAAEAQTAWVRVSQVGYEAERGASAGLSDVDRGGGGGHVPGGR